MAIVWHARACRVLYVCILWFNFSYFIIDFNYVYFSKNVAIFNNASLNVGTTGLSGLTMAEMVDRDNVVLA